MTLLKEQLGYLVPGKLRGVGKTCLLPHGFRFRLCSLTTEVNWLNRASSGMVVTLSEWHEVILRKGKQMRSFWLSAEES